MAARKAGALVIDQEEVSPKSHATSQGLQARYYSFKLCSHVLPAKHVEHTVPVDLKECVLLLYPSRNRSPFGREKWPAVWIVDTNALP